MTRPPGRGLIVAEEALDSPPFSHLLRAHSMVRTAGATPEFDIREEPRRRNRPTPCAAQGTVLAAGG